MLRELHITNLAVIEDIRLELDGGLNCFTGQTGAGKSLILGAFEILLGLKSTADMLRPDCDEARITGVFELSDAELVEDIADAADAEIDPSDQLLIARKLFASGRSSYTINGQPATAAMIRAIGEMLVDIHGQHDHQYLLKCANQLDILDAFAKSTDLRQQFAARHGELRELVARKLELTTSSSLRKQQLELYCFQADEIDAAQPIDGEYDELQARHKLLANMQQIKAEAGNANEALTESEGAIVERAQMVAHVLLGLAELDEQLSDVAEQIRAATLSLQESAYELSRYIDRLEFDPAEFAEIEDRLNTLNRLLAKYVGPDTVIDEDPIAALIEYRETIQDEIDRLRGETDDLSQLDSNIEALIAELKSTGRELTGKRKAAAKKLTPLVEKQLKDLGMGEAKFEVEFAPVQREQTLDNVAREPARLVDVSPSGLDRIELLVQTNPGQPSRPLRKIASGGELSRIMLALKSILARADRISVLVFDEIDANIGGRMGTVIGEKLRALAAPPAKAKSTVAGQQILCITHLPQIAAFADRHLRITKTVSGKGAGKQTQTTVEHLTGKARVDELAEMLAGKEATATSRKQAKEMLAGAGA